MKKLLHAALKPAGMLCQVSERVCALAADRHIKWIGGSKAQPAVNPKCTHERAATNAHWAADARGWAALASPACPTLTPDNRSAALRLSIGS